jgi:hypothetical protein
LNATFTGSIILFHPFILFPYGNGILEILEALVSHIFKNKHLGVANNQKKKTLRIRFSDGIRAIISTTSTLR